MKSAAQSKLKYLLLSRPLIVKRDGPYLCLHDAFSGEVLAGQSKVQIIQEAGEIIRILVEFNCDGSYVRLADE